MGNRQADRHKYPPIAYRPPEDAREWLAEQSKATGLAVSALITQAIREYRERETGGVTTSPLPRP